MAGACPNFWEQCCDFGEVDGDTDADTDGDTDADTDVDTDVDTDAIQENVISAGYGR